MTTVRSCVSVVLTLVACCIDAALAHAGPGANMNICVYLEKSPGRRLQVNVAPISSNCLNDTGGTVTFFVDRAGVTCGSVGYVEAKKSGTCFFRISQWEVGYVMPDTPFRGAVQMDFGFAGGLTLQSYPPGTTINHTPEVGKLTGIDWGGQGPLYIVFTVPIP